MDDASLDDFLDAGDESSDQHETATEAEADATAEADAATPAADDADDATPADGGTSAAGDAAATIPGDAESTAATADTGNEETEEQPRDDVEPAVADVEPARSTMTFTPDPGECAACGQSAGRRWTDGEDLVCGECKEW